MGNPTATGAPGVNSNTEEIDPRCIVKFRPADDWEGEYGFDWFREGDYGELLNNGERNDGQYNYIMVNGVRSNTFPNGDPVQQYPAIAKTDYNHRTVNGRVVGILGRYFGDICICMRGSIQVIQEKDEVSSANGKILYMTKMVHPNDSRFPIYYSKDICTACQYKRSCTYRPSRPKDESPMIYNNRPLKADPDIRKIQPTYLLPQFLDSSGILVKDYVEDFVINNYHTIQINTSQQQKYIIPFISLFFENDKKEEDWGKHEATVQLLIKAEPSVKGIIFDCDRGITCSPVLFKFDNGAPNKEHVKIALSKDFKNNYQDAYIRVKAIHHSNEETLAGKICVVKCIPKYVDIIFVPVPVRINKGIGIGSTYFEHISEQAGYLKRFLRQAHVIPNIKLACFKSETMEKITRFVDSIKDLERLNNQNPYYYILKTNEGFGLQLGQKLEELFNKDYPNYRNAYKVFLIGVKGQEGLLGRGNGIPSKAAIILNLSQDDPLSTICHELLHCFGLFHSFSNNSPYTFNFLMTSNIMDYNDYCGLQLLSSWKWQWEKIQAAKGIKLKEEPWNLKELPTVRIKE